MDKVILINKPSGCTSRDVVNAVCRKFNTKSVGHFGTLDPLASGLLVIGIGALTKLSNFSLFDDKVYRAEVLMGVSTDTYDITGNIIGKSSIPSSSDILSCLNSFVGTCDQEVPIYSAVKVNGRKLYEYAHNGESVSLPSKPVSIYSIYDVSFYEREGNNYFSFSCHVSKGTYIRSLINDISKKLNTCLCMSNLKRLKQGKFSLSDACSLSSLESGDYKLFDIRDILDLSVMEVPTSLDKIISNGGIIPLLSSSYILFVKNDKYLYLYGPYKSGMKPYLTFKSDNK